MKLLAWAIAAAVAVVVIAFAVANRGAVPISVEPLPYVLEVPVWVLSVGALAVGFLAGALVRWLLDLKWHRAARRSRRRARALERELAEARARLAAAGRGGGAAALAPKDAA